MGWFASSPSITALLLNRRLLFNVLHRLTTSRRLYWFLWRNCDSENQCCSVILLTTMVLTNSFQTGVSRLLPIFTTSTCVFAYKMSLILRSCLVSDLTDNEIRQPCILSSANMNEFWTQKKKNLLKKFFSSGDT